MSTIAIGNPFVPPEWIAAHGLEPRWLQPQSTVQASPVRGRRGVCPFAAAVADAVSAGLPDAAVVLTTACDQMRYAASLRQHDGTAPVFLMNIPATWQTPVARAMYVDELRRLGRFLVQQDGTAPTAATLADAMRRFEQARTALPPLRPHLSAREFAAATLEARQGHRRLALPPDRRRKMTPPSNAVEFEHHATSRPTVGSETQPTLALVGGPLPETDYGLLDWIEQAGGRVVLDATEWGERTLPRPFDWQQAASDPFAELADAYFGSIPDVFQRPNDRLYEYLTRELAARRVCGLVVRRYLWCDLWHAEVARLRDWSPVPVLDLDVADDEAGAAGRTRGRIEAFVEMLGSFNRDPTGSAGGEMDRSVPVPAFPVGTRSSHVGPMCRHHE